MGCAPCTVVLGTFNGHALEIDLVSLGSIPAIVNGLNLAVAQCSAHCLGIHFSLISS